MNDNKQNNNKNNKKNVTVAIAGVVVVICILVLFNVLASQIRGKSACGNQLQPVSSDAGRR